MRHLLLVVCAMSLAAATAQAQHARFVLIGEPNPDAATQPMEHRFIHPVSSPYFHEDSFVTTDIRAHYLIHNFPDHSPLGGGDANIFAVQVRLAITNQIQLVAYKDGHTDYNADGIDESGWNDVAAGLKWNFWQDFNNQMHMAAGVGYEIGIGDQSVLHNDDAWRLWVSANKGFGPVHLGATLNYHLHDDNGDPAGLGDADYISWHVHGDVFIHELFSPLVEFNGYHVTDESDTGPAPNFQALDAANIGGGAGEDVVTMTVGAASRPILSDKFDLSIRFGYEWALTRNNDIFGDRYYISLVLGF